MKRYGYSKGSKIEFVEYGGHPLWAWDQNNANDWLYMEEVEGHLGIVYLQEAGVVHSAWWVDDL